MSTINLNLSDDLKRYVEKEASRRGYKNSSEFLEQLLEAERHRDLKREIEQMLLETADGPFSEWTEKDVDDIQRAGDRILKAANRQTPPCEA